MSIGRKIGIWVFLFILLLNSGRTNFIMGLYAVDSQLFVELFCENTDKPEMACNGNCELSKMTQNSGDHSEDATLLEDFQREIVFYSWESELIESHSDEIIGIKHTYHYANDYHFTFTEADDRPPIAA